METNLENLIDKSVRVRESLSRTLAKNFPIEKDFADFLAMDVVNQAIGVDALERYNTKIQLEKIKREQDEIERQRVVSIKGYKQTAWKGVKVLVGGVLPSILLICLVGWVVMGIHSCRTASPYPRVYQPIPEVARFADAQRSSWEDNQVDGLSDVNNLCVESFVTWRKVSPITCIHHNKAESLNNAMQHAVDTDFNGVVWNEPNGNGEVWKIERNNYRFVITATKDESFIEP